MRKGDVFTPQTSLAVEGGEAKRQNGSEKPGSSRVRRGEGPRMRLEKTNTQCAPVS